MNIRQYVARVPDWAVPGWWRVAYKIPPPLDGKFGELVEIHPDERFNKVVTGYLKGLLEDGKMPPADVAPAILNIANDFVDGRDVVIRTGDYIAIQAHLRQMK